MPKFVALSSIRAWHTFVLLSLIVAGCSRVGVPEESIGTPEPYNPTTVAPPTWGPSATPTSSPFISSSPSGSAATVTTTRTPRPTATPTAPISLESAMDGGWVLRQVSMSNESIGWGLASSISEESIAVLRTTDGGDTWRDVSPTPIETLPGAVPGPVRVVFPDGDQAWLMIEPVLACRGHSGDCPLIFENAPASLWYTRDGGQTWDLRSIPEWYIGGPVYFHFIDDKHGWIMSEAYGGAGSSQYVFLRTRDGGRNWETLKSGVHGIHEYSIAVDFVDASTGMMTIAHDAYYILMRPEVRWTRDGGASWEDWQMLPPPEDDPELFSLTEEGDYRAYCGSYYGRLFSAESAKLVVICHESGSAYGAQVASLLYSTSDGGVSWHTQQYPGGRIQFLDAQLGWVLGDEIHQTQDGGITWTKMGRVTWEGQFSFVDEFRGWAIGESQAASGRIYNLFKTEDGGRTWYELAPALAP